jgi:hypothetical protein
LNGVDDDETTFTDTSKGIDRAFLGYDRDNPTADALDALFYIDVAWKARGGGYANTVTERGWTAYGDNMRHAGDMLTDLYARYPQQPGLARCMLNVVQAEQDPRDQMELWFQRALQVNPNDYDAYAMKEFYLLPRWYGTEQDEWDFGMECAKGGNWAAKIPMIIVDELAYRFEDEKDVT